MAKEIIANVEPFETRVAVLDDGKLINLFIERGEHPHGELRDEDHRRENRRHDQRRSEVRLAGDQRQREGGMREHG